MAGIQFISKTKIYVDVDAEKNTHSHAKETATKYLKKA